jgi:phage repressor protein C with HTH and peptisase S24 domain
MRGRQPSRLNSPPNRIRELRLARGLGQEGLAAIIGAAHTDIGRWERGDRPVKVDKLKRIAAALGVSPADLLPSDASSVPVVGYVGAGQFVAFDDHAKGQGMDEIECPRGLDPKATVAVRVRGDSMAPLIQDGWLLFYSRTPEPDANAVLGKTCVVKIAGENGEEGETMVRQVRRGFTPGRFNLVPMNGAMAEDVALEWAAPVLDMKAPI